MNCINCYQEIPDGTNFCPYCGAKQSGYPAPADRLPENPVPGSVPPENAAPAGGFQENRDPVNTPQENSQSVLFKQSLSEGESDSFHRKARHKEAVSQNTGL